MRNKAGLNRNAKFLFLLPGLLGITIFIFVPFGDVVIRSFHTSLTGEFVGLNNYKNLFQNTAFRLAVHNTIRFIMVCLPLLLLISLLLAVMINGAPKWEKYKDMYLLPMAIPAATIVLVWKMLFEKQGFLNKTMETHIDFMGTEYAFWILVGSYLWKNIGFTLVLWLAGLKNISREILEAAKVDGATGIQSFFCVTLPNLKGSMYTIVVISLLNSFKSFREVFLVSGAYPQEDIYLLQHIFNNWFTNLDFDKMSVGSVLSALFIGSLCMLLQKLWNGEVE
ncbi:MAG: sugar ABC transporter permease [Lachnospiraceae bacterium]|nr:sugar ABC transporter permease [Lachnospiraceae bacterium]